MCNDNKPSLQFIVQELYKKNTPCINLADTKDKSLLGRALKVANEHCIRLDGCCTSSIFTELSALEHIVNNQVTDASEQALKTYLDCTTSECCDGFLLKQDADGKQKDLEEAQKEAEEKQKEADDKEKDAQAHPNDTDKQKQAENAKKAAEDAKKALGKADDDAKKAKYDAEHQEKDD